MDALEERLAGEAELEREVVAQRVEVGLDPGQERQQRLRLGRADERPVDDRVEERLDAEAVARAEEALLGLVPEREREHAAEPVERFRSPAVVRAEHDLHVRRRAELGEPELVAELDVVVDLAVVRDPVAALVRHRLVAGLEVDDREAPVAEAGVATLVEPHALAVRAAMAEQLVHVRELPVERRDRLPAQVHDCADPAHARVYLRLCLAFVSAG